MAKRILVPLDKKETSEGILPLIGDMARTSGATVRLLHVAPLPHERVGAHGRVIAYASQEMERLEHRGLDYLKLAEAKLDGVPVESVVRFGDHVEEIIREADAFGADLIAVTTSRRGWLRRALGSVAERVFRKSPVQALLLGAS